MYKPYLWWLKQKSIQNVRKNNNSDDTYHTKFKRHFQLAPFGLRLYVPVNNFSVMSRRSHRFLGITSTFWEVNVSCSRIQHGDLSGVEPPTSRSGVRRSTTRPPRLPMGPVTWRERLVKPHQVVYLLTKSKIYIITRVIALLSLEY